jgi:hypothetical protein
MVPDRNYGREYGEGHRISTARVESTVDQLADWRKQLHRRCKRALCAPIAFDARAKLQADLFEGPCSTLSAVFAPCGITRESPCPCNPAVSLRSHSEYINVGREEDRGDR